MADLSTFFLRLSYQLPGLQDSLLAKRERLLVGNRLRALGKKVAEDLMYLLFRRVELEVALDHGTCALVFLHVAADGEAQLRARRLLVFGSALDHCILTFLEHLSRDGRPANLNVHEGSVWPQV